MSGSNCNMPRVLRFGREGFVYMIYPSRYHTHVFSTYRESMGGYVAIDLQKYVGLIWSMDIREG